MLLAEIKSVLSFAAFKPDADDSAVPWRQRFDGRKSVLLNVSRSQTSWRGMNKKGKLEDGGVMDGEFADVTPQRGEEWRGMTESGWCGLSVNHRFIISLENNLMRGDNCVSLLRTNPRAVLGPKYDRGKRYAVCHHPETTASLLLAVAGFTFAWRITLGMLDLHGSGDASMLLNLPTWYGYLPMVPSFFLLGCAALYTAWIDITGAEA